MIQAALLPFLARGQASNTELTLVPSGDVDVIASSTADTVHPIPPSTVGIVGSLSFPANDIVDSVQSSTDAVVIPVSFFQTDFGPSPTQVEGDDPNFATAEPSITPITVPSSDPSLISSGSNGPSSTTFIGIGIGTVVGLMVISIIIRVVRRGLNSKPETPIRSQMGPSEPVLWGNLPTPVPVPPTTAHGDVRLMGATGNPNADRPTSPPRTYEHNVNTMSYPPPPPFNHAPETVSSPTPVPAPNIDTTHTGPHQAVTDARGERDSDPLENVRELVVTLNSMMHDPRMNTLIGQEAQRLGMNVDFRTVPNQQAHEHSGFRLSDLPEEDDDVRSLPPTYTEY